ncbi:MAG TPA: cytochrome P450 [Segeticoccus sp.]|uniref:cytochrome P450 n=1 Tax=Segeticoccus sp. TaxID=2706531 RepID=UPI002D7EB463|nr:cytochrome P450 [Segeticoccus sp.]HET8601706.1 cytochrome P450 [Segeticoccus sp.]
MTQLGSATIESAYARLDEEDREATRLAHDPGTYQRGVPYAELARLRARHGVVPVAEPALPGWPEGSGYWLVLRHEDVERVVKDAATFSSWLGGTQIRDPGSEPDLAFVRRMMLNMDPPEHSRLRRMLAKSFTPRAVARLEEQVRTHVTGIVDRMLGDAASGTCDFAKDVAADLPLLTLADVLGVPAQDRWLLFDWSNRVIGWQDPDYATSASFDPASGTDMAREALALRPSPGPDGLMPDPRSREGMLDLYTYAHALGELKRADPGDDVMSMLMAQRDDSGGSVTVEEFENLFWLFAVAGNETLRNGIPGGMQSLLWHPDTQQALRQDPSLIGPAVEEMLRWWTPVMTFRRTATRDVTVAGVPMARGDKVVVSFASANRDPALFASPDTFDVRREGARAHLAFGHGPHFCLGAHLARVQVRVMFTELLTRTSWIEAAGEPAWLRSNFQRGVKRLPIAWRR